MILIVFPNLIFALWIVGSLYTQQGRAIYGNGNGGDLSVRIDGFYLRVLPVHETLNHYEPSAYMKMKNKMKDKVCMQ